MCFSTLSQVRVVLIFLIIIGFHSCSSDSESLPNTDQFSRSIQSCQNLGLNDYMALISITDEGDEVNCMSLTGIENWNEFPSIHDFYEYKQIDVNNVEEEVLNYGDSFVHTNLSLNLSKNSSVKISVHHKLDDDDALQDYNLKDVRSSLKNIGHSEGREWIQIEYDWHIMNGQVTIDLLGKMKYQFKIGDVGLRFIDYKYFKIVMDVYSGYVYWIIEIN